MTVFRPFELDCEIAQLVDRSPRESSMPSSIPGWKKIKKFG